MSFVSLCKSICFIWCLAVCQIVILSNHKNNFLYRKISQDGEKSEASLVSCIVTSYTSWPLLFGYVSEEFYLIVDKTASWQNSKLTKQQVDKTASWQNSKLTKQQVDKTVRCRLIDSALTDRVTLTDMVNWPTVGQFFRCQLTHSRTDRQLLWPLTG